MSSEVGAHAVRRRALFDVSEALWAEPPGEEVGFVLHFHHGDVGIANVADDLMVLAWHDPRWSEWEITRLP